MSEEDIITTIEKNGINLQLYISKILRENGWICSIDKLYTDDETKITREIDLSCYKAIPNSLVIPKRLISKKQSRIFSGIFGNPIKIPVKVYLSIECKYTKHNSGWVFFKSNKNFEINTLHRIIKKLHLKIFKSFISYNNFSDNAGFRQKEKIEITETALDLKNNNKMNIRDSIMETIKYIVFLLRKKTVSEIIFYKGEFINNLPKYLKKLFITKMTLPELEIFYPIVVVDGSLYLYNSDTKKVDNRKHIIINQGYLSKTFLDLKVIKKLGQAGIDDEIEFYVDFIVKEEFLNFLKKLENEIILIIETINKTLEEDKKIKSLKDDYTEWIN